MKRTMCVVQKRNVNFFLTYTVHVIVYNSSQSSFVLEFIKLQQVGTENNSTHFKVKGLCVDNFKELYTCTVYKCYCVHQTNKTTITPLNTVV